jgi:hypothetical protein
LYYYLDQNRLQQSKGIMVMTSQRIDYVKDVTIACLVDLLKYHLATVVGEEGKYNNRKYYNQAFGLLRIGAYKPIPFFIINLSDLTLELREALSSLDIQSRQFVMKQAVGRIFEDINSELFHNSISGVLKVKFEK